MALPIALGEITLQMACLPKAELAVIPAAGHEMFLDNPEASIAAVRAYLDAPVH